MEQSSSPVLTGGDIGNECCLDLVALNVWHPSVTRGHGYLHTGQAVEG